MDNIEYNVNKGTHSFVSAKKLAWHRLGRVYEDLIDTQEAIRGCNGDFIVSLAPATAKVIVDGKDRLVIPPEKSFITYREDNLQGLGTVGSRYEVVQNIEAFDFIDKVVGRNELVIETAGILGKGETMFLTAKLPNKIKVRNEDIDKYLLFTNTHDGSGSVVIMFTPIRVVCNNTLNMALNGKDRKVSFRHTKSVHDKIERADEMLGLSYDYFNHIDEIFNTMAETHVDDDFVDEAIIRTFLNTSEIRAVESGDTLEKTISTRRLNTIKEVKNYYINGIGQKEILNTKWGVYNALTGYYQNVKSYSNDTQKFDNLLREGTDTKKVDKLVGILMQ